MPSKTLTAQPRNESRVTCKTRRCLAPPETASQSREARIIVSHADTRSSSPTGS